jgi:hypothetical protein
VRPKPAGSMRHGHAKRSRRAPPSRALLLRAVRWARLPGHGHTIAQALKRFAISAAAYRKAARELGSLAVLSSDEDFILAGLHPSGPTSIESLIYYYAWINHAGIAPDQVLGILERLIAQGLVRHAGGRFELAREWP